MFEKSKRINFNASSLYKLLTMDMDNSQYFSLHMVGNRRCLTIPYGYTIKILNIFIQ